MGGIVLSKAYKLRKYLQSTVSSLYKSILDLNWEVSSSGATKLLSMILVFQKSQLIYDKNSWFKYILIWWESTLPRARKLNSIYTLLFIYF